MLAIIFLVINIILLSYLLLNVAGIDIKKDYIKPAIVIIGSQLAAWIPTLILTGTVGSLVSFAAGVVVFFILLGKLFEIDAEKRKAIIIIYVCVQIAFTAILIALSGG